MDQQKLDDLVAALDSEIPRDGGKLRILEYGGGPNESYMLGTRAAYLRVGVEILKGALGPATDANAREFINIPFCELIDDQSDVQFDCCEVCETPPPTPVPIRSPSVRDTAYTLFCFGLAATVIILVLLGFGTLVYGLMCFLWH